MIRTQPMNNTYNEKQVQKYSPSGFFGLFKKMKTDISGKFVLLSEYENESMKYKQASASLDASRYSQSAVQKRISELESRLEVADSAIKKITARASKIEQCADDIFSIVAKDGKGNKAVKAAAKHYLSVKNS